MARVISSTCWLTSVRDCITVIWMIWFIMSLVSMELSMPWFCIWVTISRSISSKVRLPLGSRLLVTSLRSLPFRESVLVASFLPTLFWSA